MLGKAISFILKLLPQARAIANFCSWLLASPPPKAAREASWQALEVQYCAGCKEIFYSVTREWR